MNFDELIERPAVQTKLPSLEVRRWVVRAIWASLQVATAKSEAGDVLSRRGCRGLLQRFVDVDPAGEGMDAGTVLTRCEALVEQLDEEFQLAGPNQSADLVDGLAQALRFTPAERAVLTLALHANNSPELQRAIDLGGEVDDEDASLLFSLMLGLEQDEIAATFNRNNPLRRLNGFELCHGSGRPFLFLRFIPAVAKLLRGNEPTVQSILSHFFRCSPPPRLTLEDFEHTRQEVALLKRYLGNALATDRTGVNILLHGAPGTGKTELVRALAASLGAQLMEVPSVDEDRDPLPPIRRLYTYCAAQEVLRHQATTMVLFDEVEDVFPDDGHDMGQRHRSSPDRNKGWITEVLEGNARPAFWVSNTIRQMDPAYLRRFDMVVELAAPSRAARRRLVEHLFAGLPVTSAALERLTAELALAPGHLDRLAGVLRAMGPADAEEAGALLNSLMLQTLKALDAPTQSTVRKAAMPYRDECVNADVDLVVLTSALVKQPSARLCLHGPSGTGKTEWARQLATALGRPLHVKRISELKGMFVGQTEQLIAAAFREAEAEGAALLIDEADSLLGNRDRASQQWEVSMVNEMLTCMERFEGVFMATTNRLDAMDTASARRFDFKVGFDYLSTPQARVLFADLLQALDLGTSEEMPASLDALKVLTPGDFVNVYRQAQLLPDARQPPRLVAMLAREQLGKPGQGAGRRIGFV